MQKPTVRPLVWGLSAVQGWLLFAMLLGYCVGQELPGCKPGRYLNDSSQQCLLCTEGTYNDQEYYRNSACHPCIDCKDGKKKVTPCNETHNTVCKCSDGEYEGVDGHCIKESITRVSTTTTERASQNASRAPTSEVSDQNSGSCTGYCIATWVLVFVIVGGVIVGGVIFFKRKELSMRLADKRKPVRETKKIDAIPSSSEGSGNPSSGQLPAAVTAAGGLEAPANGSAPTATIDHTERTSPDDRTTSYKVPINKDQHEMRRVGGTEPVVRTVQGQSTDV